jgi:hypothetical protein
VIVHFFYALSDRVTRAKVSTCVDRGERSRPSRRWWSERGRTAKKLKLKLCEGSYTRPVVRAPSIRTYAVRDGTITVRGVQCSRDWSGGRRGRRRHGLTAASREGPCTLHDPVAVPHIYTQNYSSPVSGCVPMHPRTHNGPMVARCQQQAEETGATRLDEPLGCM